MSDVKIKESKINVWCFCTYHESWSSPVIDAYKKNNKRCLRMLTRTSVSKMRADKLAITQDVSGIVIKSCVYNLESLEPFFLFVYIWK